MCVFYFPFDLGYFHHQHPQSGSQLRSRQAAISLSDVLIDLNWLQATAMGPKAHFHKLPEEKKVKNFYIPSFITLQQTVQTLLFFLSSFILYITYTISFM